MRLNEKCPPQTFPFTRLFQEHLQGALISHFRKTLFAANNPTIASPRSLQPQQRKDN